MFNNQLSSYTTIKKRPVKVKEKSKMKSSMFTILVYALLVCNAISMPLSPDEIARQQMLEQKQMRMNAFGGGANTAPVVAPTNADLPFIEGIIYRQTKGVEDCTPAFVCKGINIFEIPYLFEHVHSSFVNPRVNNLFDTKKTQSCLANKRVLVLGDSVL